MMRTKSRWRNAGDASPPLWRNAFSDADAETDGRREGGRDDLRDMAGASREGADARTFGLTSAGEEYDLFRDHEDEEGSGTRKDLVEPERLRRGLRSPWRESEGCSVVGVLGGVRGEAKTSNWRER